MTELEKIKALLVQNQKIIRFASESVTLGGNFEDSVITKYNEDKKTVNDYSLSIDGFRLSYTDLKKNTEQSLIEINENGIKMSVKTADVVSELNTELSLGTNVIDCTAKYFLISTSNMTITKDSLIFTGEVNGLSCKIGGYSISGSTMTGSSGSTIAAGTITASTMNLQHATAEVIDCNPDNVSGKTVTFTSNKKIDTESKEDTNTMVYGLNVSGSIYATYGWDQEVDENGTEHGTEINVYYDTINVHGAISLMSSSGSYTLQNRATCDEIYSSSKDDWWSDARRKRDIHRIPREKVEKLFEMAEPVRFELIKSGRKAIGYIAQDMGEALKEAELDGIVMKQNGYYALAYSELTAFRIIQIQENQRMIERIQNAGD